MTKAQAKEQINRIAHFSGAPTTPGGWADAIDALIRYCVDHDHCKQVISDYVDEPRLDGNGTPKFPSAYDIRLMCERHKETPDLREKWEGRDITQEGWAIPHLAEHMPELVILWKRMGTATHNSKGYPLTDKQRTFAANIVKQVETHLGTAVEE